MNPFPPDQAPSPHAHLDFPAPPTAPPPAPSALERATVLLVPLVVGSAVAVALGVYGQLHEPTGIAVNVAGFSSPQTVKVWLATGAILFALVQLFSALVMYGKVSWFPAPSWIGRAHRWSGRIAFLLTIPVAVHCLYALGFQSYDTRVLLHSLVGCVFFGAFTVKMLLLTRRGLAGWVLPVAGGVVFAALTGLWLTSSLWFFTTVGVEF
ncbi:DUF6529 family protein [Actinomycetes bacterium KLBMP 9797]